MRKVKIIIMCAMVFCAIISIPFSIASPKADAEIMLGKVIRNATDVSSFRLQAIVTQTERGTEVHAINIIESDWPNGFRAITIASDGTDDETIIVGDKRYTRSGNEGWNVTETHSNCETCDMSNSMKELSDSLTALQIIDNEILNGVSTVHITGQSNMVEKANQLWPEYDNVTLKERQSWELPRQQFLSGTEDVDLWIDSESNLIVKIRIQASFPAVDYLEAYSFDVTMDYDYDAEIAIEPPINILP